MSYIRNSKNGTPLVNDDTTANVPYFQIEKIKVIKLSK